MVQTMPALERQPTEDHARDTLVEPVEVRRQVLSYAVLRYAVLRHARSMLPSPERHQPRQVAARAL